MIPNADELKAISKMTEGDLSEVPFPVLLQALAVHKRSTALTLEMRQLQKQIILDEGVPVDCASNVLQDTIGKFMVARGVLTEEQYQDILGRSATGGEPFEELVVADKLIDASERFKLSQQNLANKLLDAFTWRSGTFHVSAEAPPVESPLKVKAPQLVLTGISKFAPEDEVSEAMTTLEGRKILINPDPPFPLKELRLSKDHQEILGLVSLGKTISELESESGMPKNKVLRLVYSLAIIGVALPMDWISGEVPSLDDVTTSPDVDAVQAIPDMDFGEPLEADDVTDDEAPDELAYGNETQQAVPRPGDSTQAVKTVGSHTVPVEALSSDEVLPILEPEEDEEEQESDEDLPELAAEAPTAERSDIGDIDELRNQIMEAYLRYRKQDALEILGLGDEPPRDAVEQAYIEFCEKMAPWRLRGTELESFTDKARELFIAGGQAFGEMCDPEKRKSILARRSNLTKNLVPEDARNAFAIKSTLLDSETQFAKGIEQMKAGQYADAIDLLQFAYDCEPQNSLYRAELAFCKYRRDPALERDGALRELREAIRIDANAGLAMYYAGTIFGESGDFQEAEPFLQKAIKLMKPDRRPIDALRQFKAADRDKPKKKRRFF